MRQIDVRALDTQLASDAATQLVDVREPHEYAEVHVPGAVLLPMRSLDGGMAALDHSRPVHVICATGNRSKVAAEILTTRGFDAVDVTGGTTAWVRSGLPVQRSLR